ncbi:MAG: hypothetical protein WD990_10600 [Acidimicrobiia bacterium]
MPVVTTCKACQGDFPSALEAGSLGTWQSLTVSESSETCSHCGAVHTYAKDEYRYEDADRAD